MIYDDACGLCIAQMQLLARLDWRHVLRLVPASSPDCHWLVPNLPPAQLMEAIHCVTTRGRVLRGARALRFVALRLPLLVPAAIMLWMPGMIWMAEKGYACCSVQRYRFSRALGCQDACVPVPPEAPAQPPRES